MTDVPAGPDGDALDVGSEVVVDVGPVAHGGHCVARSDGRVLFVRHAIPGERALVRVTEIGSGGRFLRADAVEVLEASPDRVTAPCPWSGPGMCGGCDLQHVAPPRQRSLKAEVVREQLRRLAGLDVAVEVEAVPGDDDGLRWRTRVEYALDDAGRPGLRRHRSHDVVPVDDCRIAAPGVRDLAVTDATWPGARAVDAVTPSASDPVALAVGERGSVEDDPDVRERLEATWSDDHGTHTLARDMTVAARGFWQVHPGAVAALVGATMAGLAVRPGERALDLYAGVGVFAAALGEAVGPGGQVVAVEADARAVEHARDNLADLPWVLPVAARVDDAFGVARPTKGGRRGRGRPRRPARSPLVPTSADVVVLDPPRTGAGAGVVRAVADLRPRAVAYVACDPAALARDTRTLVEQGYRLASLRAFDVFPMTHHVECVAVFERTDA
ncbi:class I SAM-dependent RNA methyltransferase [Phycicoccus sp. BSK3Z-2]|uniref:Class I SAM-dependent RNA methyltransferase n=1 Tax=Phycicoccus avicenniae TaxID=2828860 RepID=A0A941I0T7_9MICO|nr:class I SAM-dependent RNA methyltransferase [Phycicoccus avicenniae]MBR7743434.1 class I SAM-dependent RNA methyltransferase [Phycicoccus avicenniae]